MRGTDYQKMFELAKRLFLQEQRRENRLCMPYVWARHNQSGALLLYFPNVKDDQKLRNQIDLWMETTPEVARHI